jgi:hypothetical protein
MASNPAKPFRQLTGLEATLESMKKTSRKDFETAGVQKQCESVIGSSDTDTICWLCGFNIDFINNINIFSQGRITSKVKTPMLDKASCEHVLPIKLAYTLTTLYQEKELSTPPPNFDEVLHTEYEYAHNLCNYAKLDNYFLTWEDFYKGRDFCSLIINEEKIKEFLTKLLNYTRGGEQKSIIKLTFPGTEPTEVPNLVQANLMIYAYNTNQNWFDPEIKRKIIEQWMARRLAVIKFKIEGLIEYIKNADDCGGPLQGRWSQSMAERMKGAKHASGLGCAPQPATRRGSTQNLEQGICGLMRLLSEKGTATDITETTSGSGGAGRNYEGYAYNGYISNSSSSSANTSFSNAFYPGGYPSNSNNSMKGRRGGKRRVMKRHTKRRKVAKRKYRRTTRK